MNHSLEVRQCFTIGALESRHKKPIKEFHIWNKRLKQLKEENGGKSPLEDTQPTNETPLVYHLCGQTENPESIVITEDDYRDFIFSLNSNDIFPPEITLAMSIAPLVSWNCLFPTSSCPYVRLCNK